MALSPYSNAIIKVGIAIRVKIINRYISMYPRNTK